MVIDHLYLHQGKILLALDGQPNRAFDDQSRPQTQPANLAGRNVDVFGRSQIVMSGAPQKPIAVRKDLERPTAADHGAALDLVSDNGGDELPAVHARVLGNPLS